MLRAFGGDVFDADGKKCLLNTPESITGLKVDRGPVLVGLGVPVVG